MENLSVTGLILRFLLGGGSVALAYILGKKVGGRFGGIFAAFPGVYLAAVISAGVGHQINAGDKIIMQISGGALVGMVANVLACVLAGKLVPQIGYKKGLALSLGVWGVIGGIIIYIINGQGVGG